MALPSGVAYGKIRWRAISAVADGSDADELPDAVPVTGRVRLTPSATLFLSAGPSPVTVFGTSVAYDLDDAGVLRDAQNRDVITLVATDSPGLNPTGWTWRADYELNNRLTRGSFSFQLPAGSTVDLTTVAPVGSAPGTLITRGLSAYEVAVANGFTGGQDAWLASLVGPPGTGSGAGSVPDASDTARGLVQLSGALGGTATTPTAFGLTSPDQLTKLVRDTVAALLQTGPNMTRFYDETARTLTLDAIDVGGDGPSGIALDLDGTPYYSPSGTSAVAADSDGVPYFTGSDSPPPGTTSPTTSPATFADNGDGTVTVSGPGVTDNGDGTWSASGSNVVDNGDGTYSITS